MCLASSKTNLITSWIGSLWLKWSRKIVVLRIHRFKREIEAELERLTMNFHEEGFVGDTARTMRRYLMQLDLLEAMIYGEASAMVYSQALEVFVSAIRDIANSYNRLRLGTNLNTMNTKHARILDLYAMVNPTNT